MLAAITGAGEEDIQISVTVIAPGDVNPVAFWVNRDLRKSIGPVERVNGKHDRRSLNHSTCVREALAAIARGRKHDGVVLAPDRVDRAVRSDCAVESFRC